MVKFKLKADEAEGIATAVGANAARSAEKSRLNLEAAADFARRNDPRFKGLNSDLSDSFVPEKTEYSNLTDADYAHDTDIGIVHESASRTGHRSEALQGELVEANRLKGVQTREAVNKQNAMIKDLTPEELDDYRTLSFIGSERNIWIDEMEDYLDALNISQPVRKALRQEHLDSDAAFEAANRLDRKKKNAAGYMTDENGFTVKKEKLVNIEYADNWDKVSIKDPDGNLLNYRNITTKELEEKYLNKGYDLVRVHAEDIRSHNLDYTHYLTENADISLKPLSRYTLPYKAGLSRGYTKDTHFVKIGRAMYSADGVTFNGFSKTLIAGNIGDYKRLQRYADDVNKVIEAYNRTEGDLVKLQRALDALDLKEFKVTSAQDVKALIRSAENPTGLIDPNYRAQVLSGSEKLDYNNGLVNLERLEDFDRDLSEMMYTRGNYYRGRGDEVLDNINNGYKHVVDPLQMWRNNIEGAIFNNTYGDILQDWGEYFKNTYAKVLKFEDWQNINRMSGAEAIATATIDATNDSLQEMATAARRCQMSYKNILNIPTRMDTALNKGITNAIKGVLPKSWWNTRAVQNMMNSSPVNFANAVVFRTYLGVFNIAQLFKQGPGAMVNTFALDPINGARALASLPAVIMGHFFKNTPVIKYIPKLLAGLGGISPKQYEGFLKLMDKYGTFSQMTNRPELAQECGTWLATAKGWMNADLVFLNMGNNLGQLYADLTSYIAHGGKDIRAILRYSDDLLLNINRTNTSTLQRSIAGKLVGQFTSYPISALESLRNKRFKTWQRASFALSQLGLWGLAGTFGKEYATNIYNAFGITGEEDPEIMKYVVDGFATSYFAELGIDVREGADILGLFNQVAGMIPGLHEMFGMSPDLPIANIGSIFGSMYSLAKDAIDPNVNTWDTLHWARRVASDGTLPSGLKNLSRAYIAFDAKQFWDKNGDILRRDVKTRDAFLTLMGFGPVENMIKQRVYKENQIIKGVIDDYFKAHVKPYLDRINTYNRTGYGKTELEHNRTGEWIKLYSDYKAAIRDFQAFVKEFHPEYQSYITDLVTRNMNAGKDFKENYTDTLRILYDHQYNIQGVRQ